MKQEKPIKFLRYAEYYDIQSELDNLFEQSKGGKIFDDLMPLILSRENILLAYRAIKKNHGSSTAGTDNLSIDDIGECTPEEIVANVRYFTVGSKHGYRPKPVRRVDIPKPNGKTRPLGIPCIWDRLIQQCVKQIMEPICEAKFSPNSFGFRPDTSVEHALGCCYKLLQLQKMHFVVEIDIESFFDNVDHSKLIKQIWALGIHDKTLIYLIKQMLKAPIKLRTGETIHPTKGTPQGGIISPLLANIYLNEFDQWIDSQWQNHPIANKYAVPNKQEGKSANKGEGYKRMRRTSLKEIYLVRYADDIRIFARTYREAIAISTATEMWMKERLRLTLSQEKSRVVNATQKYTEFLGFKIRLRDKGHKKTVESHMSDKSYDRVRRELKEQISNIVHPREPEKTLYDEVRLYNSMVVGIQEYYKYATDINIDCIKINWEVLKVLKNRTTTESGGRLKKHGRPLTPFEKKRFGNSKMLCYLAGTDRLEPIYPIGYISTKYPMLKRKDINRYTPQGRAILHSKLGMDLSVLRQMLKESSFGRSAELMDNRLSHFTAQNGRCAITKEVFTDSSQVACHHIVPREQGGTDKYDNLILILPEMHRLIHATRQETIENIVNRLEITQEIIDLINKYRSLCGNEKLDLKVS